MSDKERQLPVPLITDIRPDPQDRARAEEHQRAYEQAQRGSQPHIREGSLTGGGRSV